MKTTVTKSQLSDSEAAVPSQIVLVASLLGIAIAAILAHVGRTAPALLFLGLSLIFAVIAASRRR